MNQGRAARETRMLRGGLIVKLRGALFIWVLTDRKKSEPQLENGHKPSQPHPSDYTAIAVVWFGDIIDVATDRLSDDLWQT